ncbi:MAG TPA: type I methionyl aminopeptidase [Anaeromyxobacteraceae bacterium]|nr:type I methionyl aminopeptidase [Anaeromyxobacteraceae bacterium]
MRPGANDPCWCGSGTKYKKCHRDSDAAGAGASGPAASSRWTVRPGIVSPRRSVPPEIPRPNYAVSGRPRPSPRVVDPVERLRRIRRACRAAAEVLAEGGRAVRAGVTTDEIDRIVHEGYLRRGGYPSTLNYHGFPKSLCTSVNEVILHGIPDSRPLEDGDIVNLDVTIYLDGMHGDCSATFPVGEVDEASRRLVRVTRECLELGIAAVKPGRPISDIGRAIERHAAAHGYGVVRAFCGHGIGEDFHMEPQVLHYYEPRARTVIEEGMVFTVEPMLTAGRADHVVWPDGWTAATVDGGRAAQFEHTVLVTAGGAEILTASGDPVAERGPTRAEAPVAP